MAVSGSMIHPRDESSLPFTKPSSDGSPIMMTPADRTPCLASLQPGETLAVWRLDRLGRSMRHLVTLIDNLRKDRIGFKSISEGAIDTTSASGELIFHIFSALAQFERPLIQERMRAGLTAARARGRKGGRKPLPPDEPRVVLAKELHKDNSISISDICKTLRISRTTLYRYIRMPDVPESDS